MDLQLQALIGMLLILSLIFVMGQFTAKHPKWDLLVRASFWLGSLAAMVTHIIWAISRMG